MTTEANDTTSTQTTAPAFEGLTGPEILDGIAEALSQRLRFREHGNLSDDEQTAFIWGFRHGINQLVGIVAAAHMQGPAAVTTVDRMVAEAVRAWGLGVTVKILAKPETDATH